MEKLTNQQKAVVDKFFAVIKELSDNDVAITYNCMTGVFGFISEKLVRFFVEPEQVCDYPEATNITEYIENECDITEISVAYCDNDGLYAVLNESEDDLTWKWLRTEGREVLTPEQYSSAMDQMGFV